MEFDADQYEIRLCGSKNFKDTTVALNRTIIANHYALKSNFEDYNRLSDDLIALTELFFMRQDKAVEKYIDAQSVQRIPTNWSSHPCDRDRILAAVKTSAPNLYSLSVPASRLVKNYSKLKQTLTLRYYSALGFNVGELELTSVEDKLDEVRDDLKTHDCINKLYRGFKLHTRVVDTRTYDKLAKLNPSQRNAYKKKIDMKLTGAAKNVDLHLKKLNHNSNKLVSWWVEQDTLQAYGDYSEEIKAQLTQHRENHKQWNARNRQLYALIGADLSLDILNLCEFGQQRAAPYIKTLRHLFKYQDYVDNLRTTAYRLDAAYDLMMEDESSGPEAAFHALRHKTDKLVQSLRNALETLPNCPFPEGNASSAFQRKLAEWDDDERTERDYAIAFSMIYLFAEANDRTVAHLCSMIEV